MGNPGFGIHCHLLDSVNPGFIWRQAPLVNHVNPLDSRTGIHKMGRQESRIDVLFLCCLDFPRKVPTTAAILLFCSILLHYITSYYQLYCMVHSIQTGGRKKSRILPNKSCNSVPPAWAMPSARGLQNENQRFTIYKKGSCKGT